MSDRGRIDTGLTLSALDILAAVKKNFLLSLALGGLTAVLVYLLLLPMPPVFSATSTLWFDEREERLLTSDSAFSALADDRKVTWVNEVAPIVKEAAIIESIPVLTRLAGDLDLVDRPEILKSKRALIKDTVVQRIRSVLPAASSAEEEPPALAQVTPGAIPIETVQGLAGIIKITTDELAQIIAITVSSPDPQAAMMIANQLPETFLVEHNARVTAASSDMVGWLDAQLESIRDRIRTEETDLSSDAVALRQMTHDADVALYRDLLKRRNEVQQLQNIRSHPIRVVSMATLPTTPSAAGPARYAMAAFFAVFVGASLIFAIRELLNQSIRYPRQLDELGLHVLAAAPNRGKNRPIFDEAIRRLLSVVMPDLRKGAVAIGFTSGAPQEGKTLVARELAMTAARSGLRTVLVEADLRHPQSLGIEDIGQPGLAQVLSGSTGAEVPFREESIEGGATLTVLPSNEASRNPTELLASARMTQLLKTLRSRFELIVVDMPPTCVTADAEALAPQLDGTVLVLRHGTAGIGRTKSAIALIERGGNHIVGAFVNDCPQHFLSRLYGHGPLDYGFSGSGQTTPPGPGTPPRGGRAEIRLLPSQDTEVRSDVG